MFGLLIELAGIGGNGFGRGNFAAHDDEVVELAVEGGDFRKVAPLLESEFLAEFEAGVVVGKDEAEDGGDAKVGAVLDEVLEELGADSLLLIGGGDVEAKFGGGAVGGASVKGAGADPGHDEGVLFVDPNGPLLGIVGLPPGKTAGEGDGFGVGGGHASGNGSVVDVDDAGEVGFLGVADGWGWVEGHGWLGG